MRTEDLAAPLDVPPDAPLGDTEPVRHGLVGKTASQQPQYLALTVREIQRPTVVFNVRSPRTPVKHYSPERNKGARQTPRDLIALLLVCGTCDLVTLDSDVDWASTACGSCRRDGPVRLRAWTSGLEEHEVYTDREVHGA